MVVKFPAIGRTPIAWGVLVVTAELHSSSCLSILVYILGIVRIPEGAITVLDREIGEAGVATEIPVTTGDPVLHTTRIEVGNRYVDMRLHSSMASCFIVFRRTTDC